MRIALRTALKLHRSSTYGLLFPLPCRTFVKSTESDVVPPGSAPAIKLREYQEECIQSVLSYLKKGHKRLGISLATGSGKTVIFTNLIDRVTSPNEDANQTLIVVHRRELVEQAAKHCEHAYPTKSVEIEMGNSHASGLADITIASVMSLTSGDRIAKFNPKRFKLILVDEAHHIVARGYLRVLDHFGLMEATSAFPALVGVSATMSRFDGLKLGAAIDHIVYHKDYIDMIGEKWLANVIFTTVESKVNISKVKKGPYGDFQTSDLSRVVNTEVTNEITVRAWLARAQHRKSTIVFCVDIAHVSSLTDKFREHGVDARFVIGTTAKQVRSERLDAFKAGEYPVLINCGVFTEGTDIPNIDCVLLARPTKSRNLLVQMIGRGMRLHQGKENCHVIDMVASLDTGIITVPTLFGLDPREMVEEASVEQLKELEARRQSPALGLDPGNLEVDGLSPVAEGDPDSTLPDSQLSRNIKFTDYDSIHDLIEDTSGERHIRAISDMAWVEVDKDRYILSMNDGEYLTLEGRQGGDDSQPRYSIKHTPRVPIGATSEGEWRSFKRNRDIASAETFLDAVHAADTFASKHCPRWIVDKSQAWRKADATAGQLAFLNKLRNMKDQLEPGQITKGRAGEMITKIIFGAKRRFSKMQVEKRRDSRANEKMADSIELRRREQVQVGPVASFKAYSYKNQPALLQTDD